MDSHIQAVYVSEGREEIQGHRYDFSVYRVGGRYYASWFCYSCPAHGEAQESDEQEAARAAGQAAIEAHHADRHAAAHPGESLDQMLPAMTKDQRRKELEQIRDAPGGARRITAIFDEDLDLSRLSMTPDSFVQGMIDHILDREFPGDLA